MTWTDTAVDAALARARARRGSAAGARGDRLDRRIARFEAMRRAPIEARPVRRVIPMSLQTVEAALGVAAAVLGAATPAGAVVGALALGAGMVGAISKAAETKDKAKIVAAIAAELQQRGAAEAVGDVVEALEDALGE